MNPDPAKERRRPSELIARMVASSRFIVLLATISLLLWQAARERQSERRAGPAGQAGGGQGDAGGDT